MRLVIFAILAAATPAYADRELTFSAKPTFVLGNHLSVVLPVGALESTSKPELSAWRDTTVLPRNEARLASLFVSCDGLEDTQVVKTAIESLRIANRYARP